MSIDYHIQLITFEKNKKNTAFIFRLMTKNERCVSWHYQELLSLAISFTGKMVFLGSEYSRKANFTICFIIPD